VSDQVKFVLDETQIPKSWYNLTADLPKPLPPVLHPGTKQPIAEVIDHINTPRGPKGRFATTGFWCVGI